MPGAFSTTGVHVWGDDFSVFFIAMVLSPSIGRQITKIILKKTQTMTVGRL
jgi:hypothetical protein